MRDAYIKRDGGWENVNGDMEYYYRWWKSEKYPSLNSIHLIFNP
jgi:hypothetical protein